MPFDAGGAPMLASPLCIKLPSSYLSSRFSGRQDLTEHRNRLRYCKQPPSALIQPLEVWTGLAVCSGVSQMAQETVLGRAIGGPMLAIMAGMTCSSTGLLPLQSTVYSTVWETLMPMAAALLLLEADLRELLAVAKTTTLAFCVAAFATVVGTFMAFGCLGRSLGADGWKVAACLCASYIGGSVNFSAVAAGLGLSGTSFVAAMTADVTIMACYLVIIGTIPAETESRHQEKTVQQSGVGMPAEASSMAYSMACAALSCSFGRWAAGALNVPACALPFSALLASCLALAAATWRSSCRCTGGHFAGSEALGGALMLIFFVTIGASAGSLSSLRDSVWVSLFIATQLSVHLLLLLILGKLFQLPTQALLTASNAAIGGPATAAAMCTSRWPHMVTPALLVGTFGYAIGTPIGMLVAFVLKNWLV